MDNQKILLIVVLAVVVVGVVFFVGKSTGQAFTFGGGTYTLPPQTTVVAATSCDADDICEVKALSASQWLVTSGIIRGGGLEVTDGPATFDNGLVIRGGSLNVDRDATVQGAVTAWQLTSGRVIISSLGGQQNSYACLDENGLIFRSDNPCR